MSSIKDLMQWRFACKHYQADKKISEADLRDLLDTVRLSPSSYGLQAWKFIVVTNSSLKEKLAQACYFNQQQVNECPALVVCCSDANLSGENGIIEKHIKEYEKTLKPTTEQSTGFRNMFVNMLAGQSPEQRLVWLQKQLYIAFETLILAAAEKGIDSCPMEGFSPVEVAKILELEENVVPTLLVSLGYRNMEAPKKVRFNLEEITEWRK